MLLFSSTSDPNVALTFLEKTREKVCLQLLFLAVHLQGSFSMWAFVVQLREEDVCVC